MSDLYLNPDQIMKQEQYKDLLREAEHYRLVKAIARPEPKSLQKAIRPLRNALASLSQRIPGLGPISRARV